MTLHTQTVFSKIALSPRSNLKGILFDFDGTLVDTADQFYQAWLHASRLHKVHSTITYAEFSLASHLNVTDMVKTLFGNVEVHQINAMQVTVSQLMKIARQNATPSVGVFPLITRLSAAGYKMAIATNSPKMRVEQTLAGLHRNGFDLTSYINTIVYPTSLIRPKPAPDVYSAAAVLLNLLPSECLAIDDSEEGIMAATSAQIPAIKISAQVKVNSLSKIYPRQIATFQSLRDVQRFLIERKLL